MAIEKRVGIGEAKVDKGDVLLSAYGVGSCVVIIMYEPIDRIGGLAHVLLPVGAEGSSKCPAGAIAELVKKFSVFGVERNKIYAKIIGGATMFAGFGKDSIGKRNVLETRDALKKAGIPLVAEDVLGSWGRTVFFDLASGEVVVRSYRHGEKIL